jgi:hypothetical protein
MPIQIKISTGKLANNIEQSDYMAACDFAENALSKLFVVEIKFIFFLKLKKRGGFIFSGGEDKKGIFFGRTLIAKS